MTALLAAALSIGVVHTLVGVDHYLPFVAIGRARGWSLSRALGVTALCGVGHVVGSVALGFVGIALGTALEQLAWIESVRGSLAAWGLIAFGLVYAIWGALRRHEHGDPRASVTLWSLFAIFVLGPCEPLIPLLMAPAWQHHWGLVAGVAATFAGATIATMCAMAALGWAGVGLLGVHRVERHAHALAGLSIAGSGVAIQALGI